MGRIVIACYRPKPDCTQALRALVRTHVERLRALDLVTDRPATAMEAQDGTILEVFEWRSPEAIEAAHSHPDVLALWSEFERLCECIPAADVPECRQLFGDFSPLSP